MKNIEHDVNAVLIMKLTSCYYDISNSVYKRLQKRLVTPNFKINNLLNSVWGEWDTESKTITLSGKLFRNYEWGAVVAVLKHEVAHQIVSEIFGINILGVSHGEYFKKACDVLDIDSNRCVSSDILMGYKHSDSDQISDKIRKLFVKGNDKSVTLEESQIFLNKAQELMIRHNISMFEICGRDRLFISRPVGYLYKKLPCWVSSLADIISKHYNIEYIIINSFRGDKRIEFFGEPHNLDIAEYVFHAILIQAEYIYSNFVKSHKKKMKDVSSEYYASNSASTVVYGANYQVKEVLLNPKKISKQSFLHGLIVGYDEKLSVGKKTVCDKIMAEDGKMVIMDDKLLKEMFNNNYRFKIRTFSPAIRNTNGYSAGKEAGKNLSIKSALHHNGNRGLVLA